MDDLLSYVKGEIGLNHNDSDSSGDGKETDSSILKQDEKTSRNKELEKKFFNIELKLRTFIKENEAYDIISKSNFQSFINDQRLKTPCSNKNKGKELTSPITYNLFQKS